MSEYTLLRPSTLRDTTIRATTIYMQSCHWNVNRISSWYCDRQCKFNWTANPTFARLNHLAVTWKLAIAITIWFYKRMCWSKYSKYANILDSWPTRNQPFGARTLSGKFDFFQNIMYAIFDTHPGVHPDGKHRIDIAAGTVHRRSANMTGSRIKFIPETLGFWSELLPAKKPHVQRENRVLTCSRVTHTLWPAVSWSLAAAGIGSGSRDIAKPKWRDFSTWDTHARTHRPACTKTIFKYHVHEYDMARFCSWKFSPSRAHNLHSHMMLKVWCAARQSEHVYDMVLPPPPFSFTLEGQNIRSQTNRTNKQKADSCANYVCDGIGYTCKICFLIEMCLWPMIVRMNSSKMLNRIIEKS